MGRGTIRIDCMRGRVMSRRIFLGFMLVMNVVHLFCADRQEQLKHLCEVLVYVPEENGNGGSLELDAFHPSLPSDADCVDILHAFYREGQGSWLILNKNWEKERVGESDRVLVTTIIFYPAYVDANVVAALHQAGSNQNDDSEDE